MKKLLVLLLTLTLVLGMNIPAYAAGENLQQGITKDFSETSITIIVDGKDTAYTISKATVVLLNDLPSTLTDAAYKGTKVTFKASGNAVTELNFAEIGEQHQGLMNVAVTYPREMMTDTSTELYYNKKITAQATKEEAGEESDNSFAFRDNKTVDLGAVELIPNSLKVSVDGKELKVIYDEKTEFENTVVGDEVKISYDTEDENQVVLNFEKEFTADTAATQADAEKIIKVDYKKKIFKVYIEELYKFILDEDVYVELNGIETTLVKAMNRATYAYYVLNPQGRIIYINSFYQELECAIDSINGDTISISVNSDARTPFKDTLKLSPSLSINGGSLSVNDLKAGDIIKLTVDPYSGYQVTSIAK